MRWLNNEKTCSCSSGHCKENLFFYDLNTYLITSCVCVGEVGKDKGTEAEEKKGK